MLKIYREDFLFAVTILSIVSSLLHFFVDAEKLMDLLEKKKKSQMESDM